MSGGRWVREKNGDYQHYTDEEYAESQRAKLGMIFGAMLVGGPVLMFLFNEMLWGAIVTLIGIVGLFIVPGYTIGAAAGCGIILGVILYFSNSDGKKKEEKKEDNKEAISAPPTTQETQANTYSAGTVEDESFLDNEEISADGNVDESVDEESIEGSSDVDNSNNINNATSSNSNMCYYVYGTIKELREQNILSGDIVNTQTKNLSYFTEIKGDESKVIKLYSKKAEVYSRHPEDSYELSLDNNGNYMLNIINPGQFWKYSRLLVISID